MGMTIHWCRRERWSRPADVGDERERGSVGGMVRLAADLREHRLVEGRKGRVAVDIRLSG